jgi:hypothetical protein
MHVVHVFFENNGLVISPRVTLLMAPFAPV